MEDSGAIAWLVPSHGNPSALHTIQLPHNKSKRVKRLADAHVLQQANGPALRLGFDDSTICHDGFVLGTDPASCDIVLPKLPGISRRHCCITFDSEARLVLRDFSRNGTAVWYDRQSNGDRCGFSWLLSSGGSYGFPDMVTKIVIDIQTIRFQVIVNDHSLDLTKYQNNVDAFLGRMSSKFQCVEELVPHPVPVSESGPSPVYVKYSVRPTSGGVDQTYLWNTLKPWEPIIRVVD